MMLMRPIRFHAHGALATLRGFCLASLVACALPAALLGLAAFVACAPALAMSAPDDEKKFDAAIDEAYTSWKGKEWAKAKESYLKAEGYSKDLFHDFRIQLAYVFAQLGERAIGLRELERYKDRELERQNLKYADADCANPDAPEDGARRLKYKAVEDQLLALKEADKTPPPKAELPAPTPAPTPAPNFEEIARKAAQEAAAAATKAERIRSALESARRLGQQRDTSRFALQSLDDVDALDPSNAEAKKLREEIKDRWRPRRGDVLPVELKPNLNIEMVFIDGGWFWMGSQQNPQEVVAAYPASDPKANEDYAKSFADEHPRHKVRISKGFWLGKTEVTVNQFAAFVQESGYQTTAERPSDRFPRGSSFVWIGRDGKDWEEQEGINWRNPGVAQGDKHPVIHVSWNDADEFCKWLTEKHRKEARINQTQHYRLPTEAEWEYACRAGTVTAFSFGDRLAQGEGLLNGAGQGEGWSNELKASECWPFNDGYSKSTAPVGSFKPNAWGLYDMHGNVLEWCGDWYDDKWYEPGKTSTNAAGERVNRVGPQTGSYRVLRGGSWNYYPWIHRSAYRFRNWPTYRGDLIGFRLLLDSE